MKKLLAAILTAVLLTGLVPASSLAVNKQMQDGVPVWTEETVKQYTLDFIHGNDMDTLYSYYDLQVRRYMPMDTYTGMLTEIEWMTGSFVAFGTYAEFAEDDLQTKTHILHLCMEKQDLDLYFTHKNKADDWEVMAVEFVPAEKQEVTSLQGDVSAAEEEASHVYNYAEVSVQVGEEPYQLNGILTLPYGASAENKVPGVVLVHGSGPQDMDETDGQTKMFADLAEIFATRGVATLRYDKRTYTYGQTMTAEEIANITVEEETIEDAISAGKLLAANECIDTTRLVLLGHSMGAMLAPRIASEADGLFTAMVLVAGTPKSLLDIMIAQNEDVLARLEGDQLTAAKAQVDAFKDQVKAVTRAKNAEKAKELTIVGVNGYYFWEMMQVDPVKLIKKLKLPTLIAQGTEDFQITEENGIEAYEDEIEITYSFVEYKLFRQLNHLLMLYTGPDEDKGTIAEYNTAANVDKQAGRYLADWVLKLNKTDDEE